MPLSVAPALNAGALDALIFIAAPVDGLRPALAARFLTSNVPKPTNTTLSPFFRVVVMMSINAPMVLSASTFVEFVFVDNASINSLRFMVSSFWWLGFVKHGHYISKLFDDGMGRITVLQLRYDAYCLLELMADWY
jgi:hypothetical protein